MHIDTAAKEYLVEIEVRKFTKKTIRSYRNNLNIFLRYFQEEAQLTNIEVLSLAVVREFTLYLVEKGRKGSYINRSSSWKYWPHSSGKSWLSLI